MHSYVYRPSHRKNCIAAPRVPESKHSCQETAHAKHAPVQDCLYPVLALRLRAYTSSTVTYTFTHSVDGYVYTQQHVQMENDITHFCVLQVECKFCRFCA